MRFVIQNEKGAYFTDFHIVRYDDVIEADAVGNKTVHQRAVLEPLFESLQPVQALKFDTEADATAALTLKSLHDPAAFADCIVVEAAV